MWCYHREMSGEAWCTCKGTDRYEAHAVEQETAMALLSGFESCSYLSASSPLRLNCPLAATSLAMFYRFFLTCLWSGLPVCGFLSVVWVTYVLLNHYQKLQLFCWNLAMEQL